MDGENNGKPYFLMDDLGGKGTTIFGKHLYRCHSMTPDVYLQFWSKKNP